MLHLLHPQGPDARPYARAWAEAKRQDQLKRNRAFAVTLSGGILAVVMFITAAHYVLGPSPLEATYNAIARMDFTTMITSVHRDK